MQASHFFIIECFRRRQGCTISSNRNNVASLFIRNYLFPQLRLSLLKQRGVAFLPWNDSLQIILSIHWLVTGRKPLLPLTWYTPLAWYGAVPGTLSPEHPLALWQHFTHQHQHLLAGNEKLAHYSLHVCNGNHCPTPSSYFHPYPFSFPLGPKSEEGRGAVVKIEHQHS